MEQIEDQVFHPICFVDAIKHFESGQVYSVLTKDAQNNFSVLSKTAEKSFAERVANQIEGKKVSSESTEDGFLIHIVT